MELEKAYDPAKYEKDIYKLWENSGAFAPDLKAKGEPFTIILPPPNANGDLHLGHAMYVIEDIMTRYHRMKGDPTLWLPGADHAGIETQVVYERELAKQGRSRFDLGREKFYDEVMAFTRQNMANMTDQLRKLGFSLDWSRFKFTLDEDVIETVYATFRQMHDDGLIYRGNRIVNWCTSCLSSFADIEVKYEDRDDFMYTLDYGSAQIATTRPETIFADTAVAVNPKDPRYLKLIGQTATIPLVDRPIPVIADNHVDPKTGTGALKVTPGHDPNDFEIGLRHNLPEISVIDLNGQMVNVPEDLAGLNVEEARAKTVELLKAAGKLVKTAPLRHAVGTHGRCGTVIEPLITEQWWLKVEPLTAPAIKAVEDGEIKIVPKRFEKLYVNWLKNLHDWNISRQNWWGIRIPVYYKTSNDPDKDTYLIAADETQAKKYYGAGNYRPETDTFDTWFSSGQWPFATLGYPDSPDLKHFYPTSVMETGRDILFLWVTRMVMLGIYRTGQVPFRTVYLHGMVNDEHGKKMSKSKGNVINPLVMTDRYGTDALRLALTIGITPGNDGALSEKKIEGYRNFNNKLWNVARFVLSKAKSYSPTDPESKTLADKWILTRLSDSINSVTKAIEDYRFSEAGQLVYSLLWDDFADWYLEASKSKENLPILIYGLETILKLAHPFAPFVTETIWRQMAWQKQNLIITPWPEAGKSYQGDSRRFAAIQAIVSEVRSLSRELNLTKPVLTHNRSKLIEESSELITRLAGLSKIEDTEKGSGLVITGTSEQIWIQVDRGKVADYLHQLEANLRGKDTYIQRLDEQLSNKQFIDSAPAAVVQEVRDRKAEALLLRSKLDEQIRRYSKV